MLKPLWSSDKEGVISHKTPSPRKQVTIGHVPMNSEPGIVTFMFVVYGRQIFESLSSFSCNNRKERREIRGMLFLEHDRARRHSGIVSRVGAVYSGLLFWQTLMNRYRA